MTRSTDTDEPRASGERAALVRVTTRASRVHDDDEIAMEELAGLARAAGAQIALTLTQDRVSADSATFLGKGKAEELARAVAQLDIDLVIVDNELSPAQTRNLEEAVHRRVIDRTALILDIFARRARTREGQLQVELAQLKYRLPRLAGSSDALSRLGGGIGTRGPGETKLETDRRRIRYRVSVLEDDIAHVQRRRSYLRARRRRLDVPVVALVGYTNAGKTTLFNRLTGSTAVASDALFVTLDPLMRRVKLSDARQMVMADTVGFLDRLPHQLVAAFHATLEEVATADLLLHVIDATAPDRERRAEAVASVLREVGAQRVPSLEVYNKVDRLSVREREALALAKPDAVLISALEGDGRDRLLARVASALDMDAQRVCVSLGGDDPSEQRLLADLYRHARVVSHVTEGGRAIIEADVPKRLLPRLAKVAVGR